jgi:LacI family transcriptional regulator
MATIVDVAKRASVSIATVSGVVNGTRRVSPELTRRVQEAILELDYSVNHVARSLQSRRTQLIAMLVPDISDPFHADVVKVVEDVLKASGYLLIVGSIHDQSEEQARYIQSLRSNQVDGLLLYLVPGYEAEVRKLIDMKKPLVLMGRAPKGFKADVVATDHVTGTRLAVEHLIQKGHNRIGIVPGPFPQPYSADRVRGWRQALTAARLPADQSLVCHEDFTVQGGERAATRLLNLENQPTAIFAGNFHSLIGLLRILRYRAMPASGQPELMVSHDSAILDTFAPPISSVDQPSYELGLKAAELLLKRLHHPGRSFEEVLLQPKLNIRT